MKTQTWQLHEAKKRFSQVVNKALSEGPQTVTRRGKQVVVILSIDDYKKLKESRSSLLSFFRQSPLVGVELDLDRDRSTSRETEL